MTDHAPYCLDTNAFLTAWNETYRPTTFKTFWVRLDELMTAGRAIVAEEVFRELGKKDDNVHAWVKARKQAIVELEEKQIRLAKALATEFPVLAKERLGRMRADGFVIALAQWKRGTVVTAENHRGAEKIPNICDKKQVRPQLLRSWTRLADNRLEPAFVCHGPLPIADCGVP